VRGFGLKMTMISLIPALLVVPALGLGVVGVYLSIEYTSRGQE
jgi:hypothetical protein